MRQLAVGPVLGPVLSPILAHAGCLAGIVLALAQAAAAAPPEGAPAQHARDAASGSPNGSPSGSGGGHGEAASRPVHGAPLPATWKRVRVGDPRKLFLRSQVALVVDEREGEILYARDIEEPRPIASLTKLLTVMTVLEAGLDLDEPIEITRKDRDRLKNSRSRVPYGTVLTRRDLMRVAIVASDNRAAAALARTYPGGREAMIRAMNEQARELGLTGTRLVDASGLHPGNVSTARDLAELALLARRYPLIEAWSTTKRFEVVDGRTGRRLAFRNTNSLVHRRSWDVELSKTGFTSEAGNCLLMRTTMAGRSVIVVLLNSWGKLSKYGDSGRIRRWLRASEQAARRHEERAAAAGDSQT